MERSELELTLLSHLSTGLYRDAMVKYPILPTIFTGDRNAMFNSMRAEYQKGASHPDSWVTKTDPETAMKLIDLTSSKANWEFYAKALMDLKEREGLKTVISSAKSALDSGTTNAEIRNLLQEANKVSRASLSLLTAKDVVSSTLNYMDSHISTLPTGFAFIDDACPVRDGGLIYVGGRPSAGKTAFCMQMMHNLLLSDYRCLWVSLDDTNIVSTQRWISHMTRIPVWKVCQGKLSTEEWDKVNDATNIIQNLPVMFANDEDKSLASINAYVRSIKQQFPDLKCIFLDHIGKVKAGGHRVDAMREISDMLMGWYRELDLTVFGVCQLNRNMGHGEKDKRPSMSDFKDSGSIEEDATMLFALWLDKDNYDLKMIGDSAYGVNCDVLKNKQGPLRAWPLTFDAQNLTFTGERRI